MDDGRVLLARVIGEYVVSLRKDKNIRQERLARLAGVEQRTPGALETLAFLEVHIRIRLLLLCTGKALLGFLV